MFVVLSMASCGPSDDSNTTMDTQFDVTVNDSAHILSPKLYSYLENLQSPLGIKAVVVTTDHIAPEDMGQMADDMFDSYSEDDTYGNTFSHRGVLMLVSKNPQLIQVRVGKTYSVYCRMKGSAGGEKYLELQKSVSSVGFDETAPLAIERVFADIEESRNLSWFRKAGLRVSFVHVEEVMDDLATPSESFLNRFYFRPFLYLVGLVKQICGNWILAFLAIAIFYLLAKNWVESRINSYIMGKLRLYEDSPEDYKLHSQYYGTISFVLLFLIKLIVTVPTLSAISVLSTSRMEDILALQYAHIPSVDVVGMTTSWSNSSPHFLLIFLMLAIYYVKVLFSDNPLFFYGHLNDRVQQGLTANNPKAQMYIDTKMRYGFNRAVLGVLFKALFDTLCFSIFSHNVHEVDGTLDTNDGDVNKNAKSEYNLVDVLFILPEHPMVRTSPYLAMLQNLHRESLYLTFFLAITASLMLSMPFAVYFLVLWTLQLIMRVVKGYRTFYSNLRPYLQWSRLLNKVKLTYAIYFPLLFLFSWFLIPPASSQPAPAINISAAVPADITGMYFIKKSEEDLGKGATARIRQQADGTYLISIYSQLPTKNYILTYDEQKAMLYSDILGTGSITYKQDINTITINFEEKWIFEN